jgi:hypothetical protein
MNGAIPPLHQYAFMVWCSVKAQGLHLLPLPLLSRVLMFCTNIRTPLVGWWIHLIKSSVTWYINTEHRGQIHITRPRFEAINFACARSNIVHNLHIEITYSATDLVQKTIYIYMYIYLCVCVFPNYGAPLITAWRVLVLRMEEAASRWGE